MVILTIAYFMVAGKTKEKLIADWDYVQKQFKKLSLRN